MNINQYLTRFHAKPSKDQSLTYLSELQNLHLEHIPFENLDVIRKVPIYLNLERIYQKVVINGRGGFCYELNGLFHSLLNELGYDAQLIACTVLRPDGSWAKADSHAAILVQLEQPYLIDVGFGDSLRLPIPLDGSERTDVSGTYVVKKQSGELLDLLRKNESGWRTLYRFSAEKKELVDFHEGCVFNQVSEDSAFTHSDLITRATPDGRITLKDMIITSTKRGVKESRELSHSEKNQLFINEFNIRL